MKPASQRLYSLASLIVPVALGGALYLLIAALLEGKIVESEMANRYLLAHPISRTTTVLFCVGLVSLLLNWKRVIQQQKKLTTIVLNQNVELSAESIHEDRELAEQLRRQLSSWPASVHHHWIWQRFDGLLKFIERNGSTENVDAELKHQSDFAREQQYQQLNFVRILIWATPMLGFLGTVIGISEALGKLNVGDDNNLQAMMTGLQNSLYVAFDTTAQALLLSMIMMFLMFFVERAELALLQSVDDHALEEIAKCFEFERHSGDDVRAQLQKLHRELITVAQGSAQEQVTIWQQSMKAAQEQWCPASQEIAVTAKDSLSIAMKQALDHFVDRMKLATEQAAESLGARIGQWQTLLSDATRSIQTHSQLNQEHCSVISDVLQELVTSRKQLEIEWESRKSMQAQAESQLKLSQDLGDQSQAQWQEWFQQQLRNEEIQHHRFNQEMGLFQELVARVDTVQKHWDSHPKQEPKQFQDALLEIVSLLQLMKEELAWLHQDRNLQRDQAYRLQVADHYRKAA